MKGRSSGILLPIFSLPGAYGIGSLGGEARRFIDFLADAHQHVWQILPLVPTGSGDSPYSSYSISAVMQRVNFSAIASTVSNPTASNTSFLANTFSIAAE